MRRIFFLLAIVAGLALFAGGRPAITLADEPPLAPELQQAIAAAQPNDMLAVIVRLKDQANLAELAARPGPANRPERLKAVIDRLQNRAAAGQTALKGLIRAKQAQQRVSQATYFWIFNGLALTATPDVILEIARRPEVAAVSPDWAIAPPAPPPGGDISVLGAAEPNLTLINVPAVWALGYTGQGIVVANMDTGVGYNSFSHPGLRAKWRGGSNSWYDPYGESPTTPSDLNGHGTWTMGVMIGDEDSGTAYGVAPGAQWVAVKIFPNTGSATASKIHQGFQWLLDPDNNPITADAPHVVNNSWTWFQGCNLEFQADLQALRAAGIVPIFAAGNSALSSHSPANYPEAFAVGAVDNSNAIYANSSRGPSACDGTVYPEVVAPGVGIHTSSLYGTFFNATGTSLAAPHVAGALALLLNAYPSLSTAQQEAALLAGVVDLGTAGPDNTFGRGRIDALKIIQAIEPADISLKLSAAPNPATMNAPLTYTIAISNSGPFTATAVTMANTLAPEVVFKSVAASQGSCPTPAGSAVVCTLGNIPGGAAITITLAVTPTAGQTVTHTGVVSTASVDTDPANNQVVLHTAVVSPNSGLSRVFLPLIFK
jgi:uncharacterized repeat protein (TIGR01451 family)